MTRILVPFDFSTASEKALKFAINLVGKADELLLLNIVTDNTTSKKLAQDLKEAELKFKILTDAYGN